MKDLSFFTKVFLATTAVDFRKQARGLSVLAEGIFETSVSCDRTIFVFTNKRRDAVRLLYWDITGFAMWSKNLEKDKFKWPKLHDSKKIFLSSKELKWLLQGVDLSKIKMHEPVKFSKLS